jgi:hypothetical protein
MPRGGVRKKAGQSQGQKPAVAPYSPTVVNKVLKAPDFYVKNLQRLEVLLEQQKVALRKARQQQLWEQERQKASASRIGRFVCASDSISNLFVHLHAILNLLCNP